MHYYLFTLFCLIIYLPGCVPVTRSNPDTTKSYVDKVLKYEDHAYESDIKTVLLFPSTGDFRDETEPAVIPISQSIPLVLTFDVLYGEIEDYNVKIIHCNSNWNKSSLNNPEFLFDFNEFPIRKYEPSFNTRTPYIHYSFEVPKVKLPGNYLLVVYRGNNENDLILSQRFMVFDDLVQVNAEVGLSSGVTERRQNQQLEFLIDYSNIDISNPYEAVKVMIRQNDRWDNAIEGLKPTFVKEDQKILEYTHFNLENNFQGGNEFRFFDLRTLTYTGQNVGEIKLSPDRVDAFLLMDRSRQNEAYGQYEDINGDFIINNLESSPREVSADYVNVHFFLKSTEEVNGQVYITGELTNWNFNDQYKMTYDPGLSGYTGTLLLKQGWYNYQYYVKDGGQNPYLVEGTHYETENKYDIIVYYRPVGARADMIIGYTRLYYNNRRN